MRRTTWSIQDAKNSFSAVVDAAGKSPQTVTKHGKPAVVVVSAAEYDRLQTMERQSVPSFKDHLMAIPKDDGAFERLEGRLRDMEP